MSAITESLFKKDFKIIEILGKGASSTVYSALHISSKKKYALKTVVVDDTKFLQAFQEIEAVRFIQHKSIINIYYYYGKIIHQSKKVEIGIVMELADHSLFEQINVRGGKNQYFSKKQLWDFLETMVNVLCYVQKKGLIHRDIKPENILISGEEQYKLADFGYSVLDHQYSRKNIAGSYKYASPKIRVKFENQKEIVEGNNSKDDVYSLGVTILQMIFLRHIPFEQRKQCMSQIQILNDPIFQNIISMMLTLQETIRPNFEQLKKHIEEKRISLCFTAIKNKGSLNDTQYSLTKKKINNEKQKRIYKIKLNKSISWIILIGVDSGISVIIDDKEHNLKIVRHPVTCLHLDSKRQLIWFGSLDSKIRSIKVSDLLQKVYYLKHRQHSYQSFLKSTEIAVQSSISFISTINNTANITSPYIIGYFNNVIQIPSIDFRKKNIINGTITYASYYNDCVYVSDSNGMLKKYSITQPLKQLCYQAQSAIVQFQNMEYQGQQVIIIITISGYYHLIYNNTMKCQKMIRLTKQNIFCCIFENHGQLIAATQQGNLIDQNGNILFQLKIQGISCIYKQNKSIICCSFDGDIVKLDEF